MKHTLLPVVVALTSSAVAQFQVQNTFDFQGYNLTNITGRMLPDSNINEQWQLVLNYSATPRGADYPTTISYSLTFPEGELPQQNQSTWTLCSQIQLSLFPSNISDIAAPANAIEGDCTPYLGADCVHDYSRALDSVIPSTGENCPSLPDWRDVASCAARLGSDYGASGLAQSVMSYLEDDVFYDSANNSYFNTTTGQTINPVFHGLRSGQVYTTVVPGPFTGENFTAQEQEDASQLRLTAFTLKPWTGWIASQGSGFGIQTNANVRLICGRANSTSNGTQPAQEGGGDRSGGVPLRSLSHKVLLAAIAVAWLTCS